jgi:hypothetical protein
MKFKEKPVYNYKFLDDSENNSELSEMSELDFQTEQNKTRKNKKTSSSSSETTIEDTQVTDTGSTNLDTNQKNDDSNEETEDSGQEDDKEQSQEVDVDKQDSDTNEKSEINSKTQEPTPIDYKTFYETVTQDFKASGKTMPGVKDPEKFIKALQMATDYALKTAALKPALKRVKMLEEVTDDDLAEMLDFKKRNPEVIKKALKEANIDPLELDMEQVNYVPQVKMISDSEYDFRETVDELAKDAKFVDTKQLILSGLDARSKELALTDIAVLKALHQEVVSGRIEQIQAKALELRTFGSVGNEVTDLELYANIARQMDQNSSTIAPNNSSAVSAQVNSNTQTKQVTTNPIDPELEDKRARAGIQTKPQSKVVKRYDPTKLSDEEFMKLLDTGAEFINR